MNYLFTGIVAGMGEVVSFNNNTLSISIPEMRAVEQGASIALDGVCLTVVGFSEEQVWFDIVEETLNVTTLGALQIGDKVNYERAAKVGDEIGGHDVSGHISCKAKIHSFEDGMMNFKIDEQWMKYIPAKGFIALDGCSLTIVNPQSDEFSVALIPETLMRTRFGNKTVGDEVNVEIDARTQSVVDTVERMMHRSE